ncbi:hypothetical protein [Calothrix sp. PCC 6303]|uniref:hypothetical protein n=1 Tax=Calothrix sp. PCC 6303 TaxID=1170562 RepID=UPI0005A22988|nr:hypothetical protein [Calothrix sp. PCC 6303]
MPREFPEKGFRGDILSGKLSPADTLRELGILPTLDIQISRLTAYRLHSFWLSTIATTRRRITHVGTKSSGGTDQYLNGETPQKKSTRGKRKPKE